MDLGPPLAWIKKLQAVVKLVQDRPPGRHTLTAQCNLGDMYANGQAVKQDYTGVDE